MFSSGSGYFCAIFRERTQNTFEGEISSVTVNIITPEVAGNSI